MITIPEGYTSDEAVQVLISSDVLNGASAGAGRGALLLETYEVRRGEDRAEVLQRMIDARDNLLRTLWAHRRAGLPFQNLEQAMIAGFGGFEEGNRPGQRAVSRGGRCSSTA